MEVQSSRTGEPLSVDSSTWKATHNSRKNTMNTMSSPHCHRCNDEFEIALHVLQDCPIASSVWLNVVKMENRTVFEIVILWNGST